MTNSNDDNTNNLPTTQEPQTLSPDVNSRRLTPEQRAKAEKGLEAIVNSVIKGLAHDNKEIFGTPIPEHLK